MKSKSSNDAQGSGTANVGPLANFRILPGGIDTTPITQAIPGRRGYERGYRDAVESFIVAILARAIEPGKVDQAVTEVLDAYANNAT